MIDSIVIETIQDDENFRKLADDKTDSEEFTRLLGVHIRGYSQKKRLSEGLKDFSKKVEDAENRLVVARNVGKYKEPDAKDKELTTLYSSFELKGKIQILTVDLQKMIDEGLITREERPRVLDNLRERIEKAKAGDKAKLVEKLEGMLAKVQNAALHVLPVANIEQFDQLDKQIKDIEKLAKLPSRNLTPELRKKIDAQAEIQEEFDALVETSHMWFETAIEFKPRLYEAIQQWAASEEERKKREEEEAFQKRLREEEEKVERARQEKARKEEEKTRALTEKLEAKKKEAELKPVKEAPKKAPKPKRELATVDIRSMFQEESAQDYEVVNAAEIAAELERERQKREFAKAFAEMQAAKAEMMDAERAAKREHNKKEAEAKNEEAKQLALKLAKFNKELHKKSKPLAPPPQPKLEPAVKAKTEEQLQAEKEEKRKAEEEKAKAIEEKLAAKRLEAQNKPQKEAPEPKKKPQKQAVKMSLLNFYDDDDNFLEKLAAQEAQEKAARAAAKEKEAALNGAKDAEEAAAWQAEEDAWYAEQARIEKEKYEKLMAELCPLASGLATAPKAEAAPSVSKAAVAAAAAKESAPSISKTEAGPKPTPKPKAKRKPVDRVNMWGAPAPGGAPADDDGEDLLEKLARQEAEEKIQRAAAERAAAAEAARLERDEVLAWEREEARLTGEAPKTSSLVRVVDTSKAPGFSNSSPDAKAAPRMEALKPAPKPVRRPPPDRPSAWGAAPVWVSPLVREEEEEEEEAEAAADAEEDEAPAIEDEDAEGVEEQEGVEEEEEAPSATEEAPAVETEEADVAEDEAADSVGPSLAESLKAPKTKTAPPQPKKKEKKKWGKVDSGLMGFEY